jgi:hypothetical protein
MMPVRYLCTRCDTILYEMITRSEMHGKPLKSPQAVLDTTKMRCPGCKRQFSLNTDTYEITLHYRAFDGTSREVTC